MSNEPPKIEIDYLGGQCPVQAEGKINGVPFYFRARGEHWSLSIGPNPVWHYSEAYGDGPYDAGWMGHEEARQFIDKSANIYQKEQPNE